MDYITWLIDNAKSSLPVTPFVLLIFLLKFLHILKWLQKITKSTVSFSLVEDLRDPIIMAGFGGTLFSIYIASIVEGSDIMDALSGALLSSVYAITVALLLSFLNVKEPSVKKEP